MATPLRTAAPVGVGDGRPVVETVPLPDDVDTGATLVVELEMTTTTVDVVKLAEEVVETGATEVVVTAAAEVDAAAAEVVAPPTGMDKVTPAAAQRPSAALTVPAKSDAEQAP